MIWNIVAGLIVFILAMGLCTFFKCKIEKTLAIVVSGIILILYGFGLLKILSVGFYVIMIMAVASVIYMVVNHKLIVVCNVFSLGGIYYWTGLICACIQNQYRMAQNQADLIQWALVTKYAFTEDALLVTSGHSRALMEYPPATSLFQYYWVKVGSLFQDNRLYISMAILLIVFMIPVLEEVSKRKNKLLSFCACILIYFSLYAFYPNVYSDLAVDCFMGICFAYILFMECYEENPLVKRCSIAITLAVLILTKSSGIIFSVFAILIILCRYFAQIRQEQSEKLPEKKRKKREILRAKETKKMRKTVVVYFLAVFLSKISWSWYIKLSNASTTFGVSLHNLKWDNIEEWHKQGFYNYFKALFNYRVIDDYSAISYYIGKLVVPCIVWIVILLLFSLFICIVKKNKVDSITLIALNIGMIVYIIATSYLYLVNFSEGEVAILSCCNRYLSTYFVAVYLFVLYSFFCIMNNKQWFVLAICALLPRVLISQTPLASFIPQFGGTAKEKKSEILLQREDLEEIKEYVNSDEKLYVFNGNNEECCYTLLPIWVMPYYGTNQNDIRLFEEDNVWNHVDYVFFDHTNGTIETQEFIDEYGYLFDSQDAICDGGLYRVIYADDGTENWHLEFVAEIR